MSETYLKKPELPSLPRIKDRLSFLYVEYAKINRNDGSVTIYESRGVAYVPAATISVWLLGPGTDISHRAVQLIGECGSSIIWVGENGVRFYAQGAPLTHTSTLLLRQASLVSNTRSRLAVARKMYQLRFPGEDVSKLTMQQLRGREGARVRSAYRRFAKKTGVPWLGRYYKAGEYEKSDDVNRALTSANACLYGVVHSVICALGCSPGLGFIHTGHERSFVYDIADLYKAETSIPISFAIASEKVVNHGKEARLRMRDSFFRDKYLERCVRDIRYLLQDENYEEDPSVDLVQLWDEKGGEVASGISYRSYDDDEIDIDEEDLSW